MKILLTVISLFASVSLADAATYYVQNSPGTPAANCTEAQNIGTPHDTTLEGLNCLAAGDTVYLRSGTYTSLPIITATVNGTASQRVTISGYPGETVTIQPTGNSFPLIGTSANNYITFSNLVFDGSANGNGALGSHRGIRFDDSIGIIIEDSEIKEMWGNGIYVEDVNNFIVRRSHIHDQRTDCVPGNRWYGFYLKRGTGVVLEQNDIESNPGGGVQFYSGPITNSTIRQNAIHDNSKVCTDNVHIGGIIVATDSTGGNISTVEIYANTIYNNGAGGVGGNGHGIRVQGTGGGGFTNNATKVHNNTIFNNEGNSSPARGIWINGVGATNTDLRNNIMYGNEGGSVLITDATGTTSTHNACPTADSSCGTSKVDLAALTTCLVSSSDPRLKQGTNACVGAGTSVTTRPSPVGTTDIGAYERGEIVAAVVAGSHIEATVSAVSGIQPGAGLTGLSLTCVTCTGTPVLLANPKAGSTNTIQISVSGLTGSGSARLNLASTNITDSGYVGLPSAGMAQFLNSLSALDISGTVDNTSGDPTPPAGGLYSEFLLDEGSGEVATDNTINGNDGTVSTGVTWVNNTSGTGTYIPTAEEAGDSTYRQVASTYGQGVNPTSESVSICALVLPDLTYSQKVATSTGGNGTSQRAYTGIATVNGVKQWGQGVQASGFTSGATEFPAEAKLTLVCQRFNAATDIANLSVNRTIGTSAAANKAYTSYTFVDDFRAGNDGTFTVNSGGMTIYGMWVWNAMYISDADVHALYDSIFSAGGAVGGYAEVTHRWQKVYLNGASNPDDYLDIGTEQVEVMENGAVAIEKEVGCSGGPCGPAAFRLYVSDLAGNEGPVPQAIGVGGIGMWGNSTSNILNRGVSTCCLTEGGTPVNGVTILDSVATNTVELCDGCKTMFRWVLKVGAADNTHILTLKQDNGAPLDGVAGTTPRIKVVPARASGVR